MIVLLALASLVALLVGYAWHRSQYWSRRSIPGPKSQLFVGNLDQLGHPVENPLPFKLAEWTKQYGKVYGIQRGAANLLVISDYDMARQVFHDQFENFYERDLAPMNGNADKKPVAHVFNTRGLRWKRLRTLTSLVFTTKSLKRVFPIIVSNADKMCKDLDEDLQKQSVIDISKNLKEYTASVILRSAFGREEDREFIRGLIEGVLKSINQLRGWMFRLGWICPAIGPLLGILNRWTILLFNKPFSNFFKQMSKDVAKRKENKMLHNSTESAKTADFIDLLIETESDEVVMQTSDTYRIEKHMTVEEIIGTCILFLVAGFDTTANTLSFVVFNLARNPEAQQKLREEILEHCPDEEIDYDSLTKLKYCDSVFQESLRLNPIAAAFTSRRCTKTTNVGSVQIEKGTDVIFDVISMHRNKDVFGEDANEFRPERWLVENPPQSKFLGFGDGLRNCVGMRLAYLEQRVALVKLIRRYRIYEIPETKEAEQIVGVIMGPKSVKVKLERI